MADAKSIEINGIEINLKDAKARGDIETVKENQINLIEDDTSMEGISDSVHDTLTTDAKKIIPAINEVNDKFKDIAKQIEGGTGGSVDLTDYAKKEELPTKISELQNDSNFLTSVPSEYVTETELDNKGYLTQHQDISGKVDKVIGKGLSTEDYTTAEKNKLTNIEDGANKYTHPATHNASIITQDTTHRFVSDVEKEDWNNKSSFSGSYTDLTNKPTIPSKISQLTNDSNFLTSHQDISSKVDKNKITLGIHTDGLVYIFVDGSPVGVGVEQTGDSGDVVGNVDSNKIITLKGTLAEDTYTLRYEMEDGTFITVGELNLSNTPSYVNQIPLSIDSDGSAYNGGIGYKTGYRLSASTGNESAKAGHEVSGFMSCVEGSQLRIKGVTFDSSTDESNQNYIIFYDSNKTKIAFTTLGFMFSTSESNGVCATYSHIKDQLNNLGGVAYFRICSSNIDENSIITVDQTIE